MDKNSINQVTKTYAKRVAKYSFFDPPLHPIPPQDPTKPKPTPDPSPQPIHPFPPQDPPSPRPLPPVHYFYK